MRTFTDAGEQIPFPKLYCPLLFGKPGYVYGFYTEDEGQGEVVARKELVAQLTRAKWITADDFHLVNFEMVIVEQEKKIVNQGR